MFGRSTISNNEQRLVMFNIIVRYFFACSRYAEYGTMLEIRDRVLLKDGCSILSTVGGRRFRVLSGGERDGYDTAQVEFLRDTIVQDDQLLDLLELHDKVRHYESDTMAINLSIKHHYADIKKLTNKFSTEVAR